MFREYFLSKMTNSNSSFELKIESEKPIIINIEKDGNDLFQIIVLSYQKIINDNISFEDIYKIYNNIIYYWSLRKGVSNTAEHFIHPNESSIFPKYEKLLLLK